MHVNPETFLFVDMTPEEVSSVESLAMAIAMHTRKVNPEEEPLWLLWSKVYPTKPNHFVFETVFPLRAFASITKYYEGPGLPYEVLESPEPSQQDEDQGLPNVIPEPPKQDEERDLPYALLEPTRQESIYYIAGALNVTTGAVKSWAKRGCPHTPKSDLTFNLNEVRTWLRGQKNTLVRLKNS